MGPLCAFCGKPKRPPKVKKHPATDQWEDDPYCSRECCEADHGIIPRSGMKAGRRKLVA